MMYQIYDSLDDVPDTMDSLFSSTLDMIDPLCLRKIKEKSPTPWYNEHTRALKRAARKNKIREKYKIRGIWYCLARNYSLLQESLKNC